MVVVGKEEGHAPQHRGHRHSGLPAAAGQRAEHGGKDGKIQNVISDINFPICIIPKKLEEISQQRQAWVLGGRPRRAQLRRGVEVIVDLGDFDRRGPEAQLVKIRRHRLAYKEVHRQRQRRTPEQHAARCEKNSRRAGVLAAGDQHPHTARKAYRIQHPRRGVEHARHSGQRQHGHKDGQHRQRRHRCRYTAFQRKHRAAAEQRQHGR